MKTLNKILCVLLISVLSFGFIQSKTDSTKREQFKKELKESLKQGIEELKKLKDEVKITIDETNKEDVEEAIEEATEDIAEAFDDIHIEFDGADFQEGMREMMVCVREALADARDAIDEARAEMASEAERRASEKPEGEYDEEDKSIKEKLIALEDFNSIAVSGGLPVKLIKADKYQIKIVGTGKDINNVDFEVDDKTLEISRKKRGFFNYGTTNAKITVYYTDLTSIQTSSASSIRSEDLLKTDNLDISCSSASSVTMYIEARTIEITTSSAASVNLKGKVDDLELTSSSGSSINTKGLIAKKVEASASSGASINLLVNEDLDASASSGGSIRYSGTPKRTDKSQSSGGGIWRE
jgi:hypothetical protein